MSELPTKSTIEDLKTSWDNNPNAFFYIIVKPDCSFFGKIVSIDVATNTIEIDKNKLYHSNSNILSLDASFTYKDDIYIYDSIAAVRKYYKDLFNYSANSMCFKFTDEWIPYTQNL
jgi:hypothetical protein